MLPLANAQARFECWEDGDEQRVLEDAMVAVNRRPRLGRVARETCNVDRLAVKESSYRKEAQESGQVPDECLCPDFLPDIELRISLQRRFRIVRLPDERNTAETQDAFELEVLPQLGGHERVHRSHGCPPCQEIRVPGLQPPRARTQHHEPTRSEERRVGKESRARRWR